MRNKSQAMELYRSAFDAVVSAGLEQYRLNAATASRIAGVVATQVSYGADLESTMQRAMIEEFAA